MSESTFWADLRSEVPWRAQRLTERFDKGVPDVTYVLRAKPHYQGHVELKDVGATGVLEVSQDQALWHWHWAAAGGCSGIIARRTDAKSGRAILELYRSQRELSWIKEIRAPDSTARLHPTTLLWPLEAAQVAQVLTRWHRLAARQP